MMARGRHLESIDISDNPELLRIAEQVRSTREPRLLKRDKEDLAILSPARPARQRVPRGKPFTKDDPMWNLQAIGRSGVSDVSENKYKYLSEEYLDTHDDQL